MMDAVKKQLAEVKEAIDKILSPYGLTIDSPNHGAVSDEDWNKVWELREEECELKKMISFREGLKRDSGSPITEATIENPKVETDTAPVDHKKRIGKRIAELRKERGFSQNKLAQLTGIDSGNIGKIELGKFNPGLETLCKIGEVLGHQIDFI